jgi:hypothetical protein
VCQRWQELPTLGVQRVYTTDSVPAARERGGEIVEVLPVGGLIVDGFAEIARRHAHRTAIPVDPTGPPPVERIEGPAPVEDSSVP